MFNMGWIMATYLLGTWVQRGSWVEPRGLVSHYKSTLCWAKVLLVHGRGEVSLLRQHGDQSWVWGTTEPLYRLGSHFLLFVTRCEYSHEPLHPKCSGRAVIQQQVSKQTHQDYLQWLTTASTWSPTCHSLSSTPQLLDLLVCVFT